MEIYIHGHTVFMIMDTVPGFDHDSAMKELAKKPMQKEWEEYVSAFQDAGSKSDTPERSGRLWRGFLSSTNPEGPRLVKVTFFVMIQRRIKAAGRTPPQLLLSYSKIAGICFQPIVLTPLDDVVKSPPEIRSDTSYQV